MFIDPYSKKKHNKFVHLKKKISLQAERRHGCTRVPGIEEGRAASKSLH